MIEGASRCCIAYVTATFRTQSIFKLTFQLEFVTADVWLFGIRVVVKAFSFISIDLDLVQINSIVWEWTVANLLTVQISTQEFNGHSKPFIETAVPSTICLNFFERIFTWKAHCNKLNDQISDCVLLTQWLASEMICICYP